MTKPAKTVHKNRGKWTISVVGSAKEVESNQPQPTSTPRGSFAVMPMGDRRGNIIFANAEEISQSKFEEGFSNCLAMARSMIDKADQFSKNFALDEITLKLSANGKYGCSLVVSHEFGGAIELKIKRKP
jgi:hypothetical protein